MPDESRKKLKVVVDTNVFVSGLTVKGKPTKHTIPCRVSKTLVLIELQSNQ
jgi:predicted nucleic acid-binding protein